MYNTTLNNQLTLYSNKYSLGLDQSSPLFSSTEDEEEEDLK